MSFRFEHFDVWKRAADLAMELFRVADKLESRKLFRFADQLRGAALSMPNNIAEGSGSDSKKDFAHFLGIARKSTYENASMVFLFEREGFIDPSEKDRLSGELEELCRMLYAFGQSLRE